MRTHKRELWRAVVLLSHFAWQSARTRYWKWSGARLEARELKHEQMHQQQRQADLVGSSIGICTKSTGRRVSK